MPYIGGFLGIAMFVFWVYSILDVIASDETLVRNLPKFYWLFIVIIVPTVGAVAWFALGRPLGVGLIPGTTQYSRGVRPRRVSALGPEDSPEFLAALEGRQAEERKRLEQWEEDLRRREEELRRNNSPEDPRDDPSS